MRACLTPTPTGRTLRRKERKNSEPSGIRTRQLCGFFVPGILLYAGRVTDTTPRKGEEVRRLGSVLNLPASSRVVRKNTPARFIHSPRSCHMRTTTTASETEMRSPSAFLRRSTVTR